MFGWCCFIILLFVYWLHLYLSLGLEICYSRDTWEKEILPCIVFYLSFIYYCYYIPLYFWKCSKRFRHSHCWDSSGQKLHFIPYSVTNTLLLTDHCSDFKNARKIVLIFLKNKSAFSCIFFILNISQCHLQKKTFNLLLHFSLSEMHRAFFTCASLTSLWCQR